MICAAPAMVDAAKTYWGPDSVMDPRIQPGYLPVAAAGVSLPALLLLVGGRLA